MHGCGGSSPFHGPFRRRVLWRGAVSENRRFWRRLLRPLLVRRLKTRVLWRDLVLSPEILLVRWLQRLLLRLLLLLRLFLLLLFGGG